MADSRVSLHCYADSQEDGARHGDLGQGQDHAHQAQEAGVREETEEYSFIHCQTSRG